MRVLVAYASKHGSTRGIAERIGDRLKTAGLTVDVLPVGQVKDSGAYDAAVIGSALFMYHWMGEARTFAKVNRGSLAGKPIWLFSSGPTGDETVDKKGRSLLEPTVMGPKELSELRAELQPRDHRIFFGSWSSNYKPIGAAEKFTHLMPGAWQSIPSGDWRDWPAIEAWADSIAAALG